MTALPWQAQPTAHREADGFFLEDEPEEASEAGQAAQAEEPELASALPASPREPSSSFAGLHRAPAVGPQQHQQQIRSKRILDQPLAVTQQQQPQRRKRQKQSEGVAQQQSQATANRQGAKVGSVAEHHTAGYLKGVRQDGDVTGSLHPTQLGKTDRVSAKETNVSTVVHHPALPKLAQKLDFSDKVHSNLLALTIVIPMSIQFLIFAYVESCRSKALSTGFCLFLIRASCTCIEDPVVMTTVLST